MIVNGLLTWGNVDIVCLAKSLGKSTITSSSSTYLFIYSYAFDLELNRVAGEESTPDHIDQ